MPFCATKMRVARHFVLSGMYIHGWQKASPVRILCDFRFCEKHRLIGIGDGEARVVFHDGKRHFAFHTARRRSSFYFA